MKNIITFHVEDMYPEPNSIELLGYAKNDVVQVLQSTYTLPPELRKKLQVAYRYLNEVQEYLFNDPLVA